MEETVKTAFGDVPTEKLVKLYEKHKKRLAKLNELKKTEEGIAENRAHAKRYYDNNKEKVLAKRRAYYEANKAKCIERMKNYKNKTKEESQTSDT